jgi:hypothetical protein
MATLKERSDNWNARGIIRRDFRHSHDGPEVIRHRKKKNKKAYKRKGCPGNNGGAHVYVWTTETAWDDWWSKWNFEDKYEYHVCCGCKARKRAPYMRRKAQ